MFIGIHWRLNLNKKKREAVLTGSLPNFNFYTVPNFCLSYDTKYDTRS